MQRLDAEIIRDSILAASGGLNLEMGGPPVFPMIPEEVVKSMYYGIWKQKEDGPAVWRRSVYIYRNRGLPFPLLDVFDLPNQNIACGARNVTTVPTQALTLMNDDFVLKQAQLFADRLEEAAPGDRAKQIDLAYRIALARAPRRRREAARRRFSERSRPGGFHQRHAEPERVSLHEVSHMKQFRSRRDFLFQSGGGISGLALAYLLNQDGLLVAAANSCATNSPVPSPLPPESLISLRAPSRSSRCS